MGGNYETENSRLIDEYFEKEEVIEQINSLLKNPEFLRVMDGIGLQADLESIKEYIKQNLFGKFRGIKAIEYFFNCIKEYMENEDFKRLDNGLIDAIFKLPLKTQKLERGLRSLGIYLGLDGFEYYIKKAEESQALDFTMEIQEGKIQKRAIQKEGLYNPVIANAFFTYCGEQSTQAIPACEKIPYYLLFSKNILTRNQKTISIKKIPAEIKCDEQGDFRHHDIIEAIEQYMRGLLENKLSQEEINRECQKIKLQYAIQETLKKIICSMDENLGNTSLIISSDEKSVNIFPAYDLDLSFRTGEKRLSIDEKLVKKAITYRKTRDGKIGLNDIIKEFADEIPGYKERINEIINRFDGPYMDRIFEIAYNNSQVQDFNNPDIRQHYTSFLVARIAEIKSIMKSINQKEERNPNK